ncbi:MAG: hypothetical protein C0506_06020 [Anaerolinea sp.]|nr:hypothetical protein [Anaerolinea sp.]
MTGRVYLDEDSGDKRLLLVLKSNGIDALSAAEVGMLGASEAEQLAFAANAQRTLVSANRGDFMRIHSEWASRGLSHSGIVLLHHRVSVGENSRRLRNLLTQVEATRLTDGIWFLSNWV